MKREVAIVCVQKYGRILLMRRSPTDPSNPWVWNFPGGGIETSETPKEAAIREVKEESNLTCPPIFLKKIGTYHDTVDQLELHVFTTEKSYGKVLLKDKEHDRFAWIDPSEIRCYKTFPLCKEICKYIIGATNV